jgi:hypothetical protein
MQDEVINERITNSHYKKKKKKKKKLQLYSCFFTFLIPQMHASNCTSATFSFSPFLASVAPEQNRGT